jgi:predicted N-acetyltransferase YhbS
LIGEVCVDAKYQKKNIGISMVSLLEKNASQLGFKNLVLGAKAGVEPFYFKCGFSANLFIQIKSENCLKQLKELNHKYPIKNEEVKEGLDMVVDKYRKIRSSP